MNTTKPIKRNESLKQLSRDHHYGLLLCWKIKTGFSKQVSYQRIKIYTDWFYEKHLFPHFETEEKYVFPVLGDKNKLIKKAIKEHRHISNLFHDQSNIESSLKQIQIVLEKHIRFEERILFNEIQNAASNEQLKNIQIFHSDEKFVDNLNDIFWE